MPFLYRKKKGNRKKKGKKKGYGRVGNASPFCLLFLLSERVGEQGKEGKGKKRQKSLSLPLFKKQGEYKRKRGRRKRKEKDGGVLFPMTSILYQGARSERMRKKKKKR